MIETMLREEIKVHSDKYGVDGFIRDYAGVVKKLSFSYQGKDVEMAINRDPLKLNDPQVVGRDLIDSYIDNLCSESRKVHLHNWHISKHKKDGEEFMIAKGIVTGHPKLVDSEDMHTSAIRAISIDHEDGEAVVTTMNNVYHCPLSSCNYSEQDKLPEAIPDYESIKEQYKDSEVYPAIESGKVLLVLANYCSYYYHSTYYVPEGSEKPLHFSAWPHVGSFQDSFIINSEDYKIDLRYFPHFQNVEFYGEFTDGCPLYLENVGDITLYARTSAGTIKLEPGDRKEVLKENAEDETPILPGGDLYPAGVF